MSVFTLPSYTAFEYSITPKSAQIPGDTTFSFEVYVLTCDLTADV